ncbi:MAG TPA: hypothetical protein VMR81_04030 [Patescibacteria group bacterium]|nr:hypothetical protein [Patescibacteria group bacterium]
MDKLDEIRELLQKDGIQMNDDEIQTTISELQYLVDVWLNTVEQQIFEGKTLDELLTNIDV